MGPDGESLAWLRRRRRCGQHDGTKCRATQGDPSLGLRQPLLNDLGVVIARIVEKHMDQRARRVERLQSFQEFDRRSGVDSLGLDHLGLAGFQVDGAMNIEALAPHFRRF